MEKKVEVKTFIIKAICEKCEGEMLPDGNVLTTFPPQYSHICNSCGASCTFYCTYPKTIYEEIEANQNEKNN